MNAIDHNGAIFRIDTEELVQDISRRIEQLRAPRSVPKITTEFHDCGRPHYLVTIDGRYTGVVFARPNLEFAVYRDGGQVSIEDSLEAAVAVLAVTR